MPRQVERLFGDLRQTRATAKTRATQRAAERVRSLPRGRGPVLRIVFGHPVQLHDGTVVTADESYLRESILTPAAKSPPAISRSCRRSRTGQRGTAARADRVRQVALDAAGTREP